MLPQKVDALFVPSIHTKYKHKQRGPCRRSFSSFIEIKKGSKSRVCLLSGFVFLFKSPSQLGSAVRDRPVVRLLYMG